MYRDFVTRDDEPAVGRREPGRERGEQAVIIVLIVTCEVGFWVLPAAGLAVRYLLKWRRTSLALLLCEPLLEVVLFVVTAIDLRNGAEPS